MSRRAWHRTLGVAALLLAAASQARAAVRLDPLQSDFGSYRVYFRDQFLGTEKFSFEPRGDSVMVYSNVDQNLPTPEGVKHLDKKITMTLKALDYGLLGFLSEQNFLDRRLLRGITVHDTTLTSYREVRDHGSGETYARPPGRLFVVDGQVFVLFDVMLRSLHGKMVGQRPLSVVVLSEPRDSVLDILFAPGEMETIQFNGKPRTARKAVFSDGVNEFHTWVAPNGSMLRLEQPAIGLRVDREPAAASKPGKPAPAATGAKKSPAAKARPATTPAKPATPPGH